MATVIPVFNRKRRLNKQGRGLIEIYFYADGVKRYFGTGVAVSPNEWNDKKWIINNPNAVKLNGILTKMIRDLEDNYVSIITTRGSFDEKDLRNYSFEGNKDSFIEWLGAEIRTDKSVAESTIKHRLKLFEKLVDALGDVSFARVNYEMIDIFNKSLVDEGLHLSTIRKYHNSLRKFCGIAVQKGKIKESPYKHYKVKRPPQVIRKCLWYDDLDKLWDLEYPHDSCYELARLKFLFSCYTGLRISDNTALTWDNIRNNKIFIGMKKTQQDVVVPIDALGERAGIMLGKARKIYNGPHVFKPVSGQEVNRYLKTIGIDAQLPITLNFHMSRHTFCTLVADQTGSLFKVMEYSGIRRTDTAMIYVNLARLFNH